jgi:hypothetical protein
MAKFKVGDKVRVREDADGYFMEEPMKSMRGKIVTIASDDGTDHMQYNIEEFRYWWDESLFESIAPRREFIVIRRSGAETIAELRHDREVIKSGTATCAPSDTFDFQTGATLAFDRLMGREEQSSLSPADIFFAFTGRPAPEPPKFYTGKVYSLANKNTRNFTAATKASNRVFSFVDGRCKELQDCYIVALPQFVSIEHLRGCLTGCDWHEVKSDV